MIRRPLLHRAVAVFVIGGLVVSVAIGMFIVDPPDTALPGVALGSELILAVERAIALFVSWMLMVIVVARALGGELPAEISGRGIRYADAQSAEAAVADARRILAHHEARLETLTRAVFEQRMER